MKKLIKSSNLGNANKKVSNTNKFVSIIGYGSQGRAWAHCLRDSKFKVIIGARKNGKSWSRAKKDGFKVYSINDACQKSEIICFLLPDEIHKEIFENIIIKTLTKNKTICVAHGFSIVFKEIIPPKFIDVILLSPRGNGPALRKAFLEDKGVPASLSVYQNPSGNAKKTLALLSRSLKFTKAGVIYCTFREETVEDLFVEQNVLCGGIINLVKSGFEVLTKAGYPPEMAFYGCLYEAKFVVDALIKDGISGFNNKISNTAEFGEYLVGPNLINKDVMEKSLQDIESGKFSKKLLNEKILGYPTLKKFRKELNIHPIEKIRKKIYKSKS